MNSIILSQFSSLKTLTSFKAINLVGTIVLPFITAGGTSKVIELTFNFAVRLLICRNMVVLPLVPVIVLVTGSHTTFAPSASNMDRNGTRVLPSRLIGCVSMTKARPLTVTVIGWFPTATLEHNKKAIIKTVINFVLLNIKTPFFDANNLIYNHFNQLTFFL